MSPKEKATASLSDQLTDLTSQVNRTQRIYLMTAGVLIGTVMVGFSLIQGPSQSKRKQFQKIIAEERQRAELLASIKQQQQRLADLGGDLLLKGGAPVLTRTVSDLATQAGLQVESVAPQPEVKYGEYKKIQIQLVAQSAFPNLVSFLTTLDGHRPILLVDQLEVGEQEEEPGYYYSQTSPAQSDVYQPKERQKTKLLISAFAWGAEK